MIVFDSASRLPKSLTEPDLRRLGRLLGTHLRRREMRRVGLRFLSERDMRRLNRAYHHRNRATDVLSFAAGSFPELRAASEESRKYLGDIALCPSYAASEAKRRAIDRREELVRLLVHGVLHLTGYGHETARDEQKMFPLQERLVDKFLTHKL